MNQWRSSRCLLVLAVVLIAAAAGAYGVFRWSKPEPVRTNVVCRAIVFVSGTEPMARSEDPAVRERYHRIASRSEDWWKEIAARHPDLAPANHEVADERNGFLRWVKFVETHGCNSLKVPAALGAWFDGGSNLDRFETKRWLLENRALLDELQAIGELPDRSVRGIALERWKHDCGRFELRCAEALMLEARSVAEDGDEATALRRMRAVQGLADHFSGIEVPDDHYWRITSAIDARMRNRIIREILPALSGDRACHLQTWAPLLRAPAAAPKDYATILRANWQMSLREFLLPTLVNLHDQSHAPDADALVDTYTDRMRTQIEACEKAAAFTDLPSWNTIIAPPEKLSPECRDLYQMAMDDRAAASREWLGMQIQRSMDAAVFDILAGEPVTAEPVSGKPFTWNESRRELALPDSPSLARLKVEARKVPQLAFVR
ncbi:hypothetical protein KBB96_19585 [Luteolibacter ambystomatis]|uniref:Uncharacterized protein n=1 Tax=Luteolibacter ambystomatis TaxID=2824561 RepID=A0A975J001_9BACT|nr:hypothetical protein [Luteolibacter ambystomatis]QUE51045.1 hypothetical protein KBB96_19585 [Luteolibacter ambystomatis]